jgi:hypothetical protein
MSVDRGRAFSIVNLRTGGSGPFQPHVRVFCSNCTGRLEFACVNSRPPEAIAKTIRAKGWEFILENARYTRCPDCIILRDAARKGESPGPKKQEVELFGRSVALPVNILPPDLRAPPPPARESRVFKEKGSSDSDGIENAARRASPPSLGGLSAAGAQRYRIELTTERDLADVVTALMRPSRTHREPRRQSSGLPRSARAWPTGRGPTLSGCAMRSLRYAGPSPTGGNRPLSSMHARSPRWALSRSVPAGRGRTRSCKST